MRQLYPVHCADQSGALIPSMTSRHRVVILQNRECSLITHIEICKHPNQLFLYLYQFPSMYLTINVLLLTALWTHWGRDGIDKKFTDDISKCIFFNANIWISINISLKFVNCIFLLYLTFGFNILRKYNVKPRREAFNFWDLVRLILEILR